MQCIDYICTYLIYIVCNVQILYLYVQNKKQDTEAYPALLDNMTVDDTTHHCGMFLKIQNNHSRIDCLMNMYVCIYVYT